MNEPPERCATCSAPLHGKYCARCGEKRMEPPDHAPRRFVGHKLVAFTNADGKGFLTLRCLLTRPGRLLPADRPDAGMELRIA